MNNCYSFKEPKRKKQFNKNESVVLPLPFPILDPNNQNVEICSKNLPKNYRAVLRDKRIFVDNEWQGKALFNCGYFGKGEFSRGEATLNKRTVNADNENEDWGYSLSQKDIQTMSVQRWNCRKEWSALAQNKNPCENFHDLFMNEFVDLRTTRLADEDNTVKYGRVNFSQPEQKNNELLKCSNDPFNYVIKKLPEILLNESLALMYEEAFYLTYALGCLDVFEEKDENDCLSIEQLWLKLTELDGEFAFKYAVYHKLRSKNWILKHGMKYGCDFMAYYGGPEKYHSSYAVKVKHVDLNNLNSMSEKFTQFSALVRINETVSKDVIFCYVVYDTEEGEIDLKTPACLEQFSVLESMVNRWVPSENRGAENSGVQKETLKKQENLIYSDTE